MSSKARAWASEYMPEELSEYDAAVASGNVREAKGILHVIREAWREFKEMMAA